MTTTAVLGTGTMGMGMARSLLRAGIDVRAWNRTREKAEPLATDGAVVCDTAAEAVRGADVVVTMLYDTDSVLEVVEDAASSFGEDAVLVQTATIGIEGTERVARLAAEHGLAFLDAPVLGTKGPAEQGALVFLVAGSPEVRERVGMALDAMGSKTMWVADEPGPGSALKLVCNAWVTSINAAVGQSMAMAAALDLDGQLFLDAIDGGGADSPYAHIKGRKILDGDEEAAFTVDGVRKDLELIAGAAGANGVSTSVLDALREVYDAAGEAGRGSADMAFVSTAFSRM